MDRPTCPVCGVQTFAVDIVSDDGTGLLQRIFYCGHMDDKTLPKPTVTVVEPERLLVGLGGTASYVIVCKVCDDHPCTCPQL